jgi:hypothetical protein
MYPHVPTVVCQRQSWVHKTECTDVQVVESQFVMIVLQCVSVVVVGTTASEEMPKVVTAVTQITTTVATTREPKPTLTMRCSRRGDSWIRLLVGPHQTLSQVTRQTRQIHGSTTINPLICL